MRTLRSRVQSVGAGLFALLLVLPLGLAGCDGGDEPALPSGQIAQRLAALTSFDPAAMAGYDGQAFLAGAGSSSEAPLAARVEFLIESPTSAILQITNTSPPESSTEDDAAVLTSLGFNLLDGPAASCFILEEDDPRRFEFIADPRPFCGLGDAEGGRFAYALEARNPRPKKGLKRGESLLFRLTVDASCQADFAFAPEAFLNAPGSASGGMSVPIVAKFQVVGPGGEDSGCAQGDWGGRDRDYTVSEFIATAAEVTGSPSDLQESDTRAGSVELNFNGAYGYDGEFTDAPFGLGIATLRNGAGQVIEQLQLNRRHSPTTLDADGCNTTRSYPECWVKPDAAGQVAIDIPDRVSSSNFGFDSAGDRVAISGQVTMDLSQQPAEDNSGQSFRITWDAPNGIETARIQLRLHFDADLDQELGDDPLIPLLRIGWPGSGPDLREDCVTIVAETATSLTIEVNVQDAMDFVWLTYDAIPYP